MENFREQMRLINSLMHGFKKFDKSKKEVLDAEFVEKALSEQLDQTTIHLYFMTYN